MDKEIWKPIPGYENRYEVSNLGRVRSFVDFHNSKKNNFKILKPKVTKYGYHSIALFKNGTKKTCLIHRLVAQVFIPNPNNKPLINHIDCIKTNNTTENLEWCTHIENMRHAVEHNLFSKCTGENNTSAALTNEQVKQIRKEYIPYDKRYSITALAKKYSVSKSSIGRIVLYQSYKDVD